MSDAVPTKAALRAAATARRRALSDTARHDASLAIAERALPIIAAVMPRIVAAYSAWDSEADPAPIIALSHGRWGVALPAMVDRDTLVFRCYQPGDHLVRDALGMLAPPVHAAVVHPDLWIVPVSAFDRTGARIGKGRGVYDRAITGFRGAGLDPRLVGVAFSVQEVPSIPREPHDVRLDWIVTEQETLSFR
jgi:5-formyltetrahydrofolate cyclo-ligase